MEFKDLSIEELSAGYVSAEDKSGYVCIFCGEVFEDGLIYQSRNRMVTAERAVIEHVFDAHHGVFQALISLDKQISGISDTQKEVLTGLFMEKDNKALGREMGISTATVRTHKFNLQKMKREARILLALMAQIEDPEAVALRKQLEASKPAEDTGLNPIEKEFSGNNLHPFFTQFNLK